MHAQQPASSSEPSPARRVTLAEQALTTARDQLKEKQQQLEQGDREHQAQTRARQQAALARKNLLSNGLDGLRKQKRAAAKALQQGTLAWMDPADLQSHIQTARQVGVDAPTIDAAEAALLKA